MICRIYVLKKKYLHNNTMAYFNLPKIAYMFIIIFNMLQVYKSNSLLNNKNVAAQCKKLQCDQYVQTNGMQCIVHAFTANRNLYRYIELGFIAVFPSAG